MTQPYDDKSLALTSWLVYPLPMADTTNQLQHLAINSTNIYWVFPTRLHPNKHGDIVVDKRNKALALSELTF